MFFALNTHTKYSLLAYITLVCSIILIPKNFIYYSYFPYLLIIGGYIFVWVKILRYMRNNNDMEYDWISLDILIFDLLYILGLPIIFNLLMYRAGEELWPIHILAYIYYICIGIIAIIKVISFKTRHAGMVRFSILFLFPLANLVVINQIFNVWYVINFLSGGYNTH